MREIPLTKGQVAIVDDADYEWLNRWKWHANYSGRKYSKWYARRREYPSRRMIYMHTALTGFARTDHRDGNGLHNCRGNLRPCTQSQNCGNSSMIKCTASGFKGVQRNHKRWMAKLMVKRHLFYLGTFDTKEEAAAAYDAAALQHFGEFAKTNAMMGLL